MKRNQQFYSKKAVPPFATQVGSNHMHIPVASAFGAVLPPAGKPLVPFHGVEFQPSEVCPKNFIIFDQTDHRSQIMFHPATAQKFNGPSLNFCATYFRNNFEQNDATNGEREMSSSLKEDSDDIDALLSLEEGEGEEEEEYDEEEVSTARTCGNYGSNSPDAGSTYGSEHKKNKSSLMLKSSGSSSKCNDERKRQKMKKMVKMLRGIVPGADQMNTFAVLDEAVKYLKSLKVEVQKLGVRNFKN